MKNITDVLLQLRQIVENCRDRQSPMGYFPALYYNMTAAVRKGIQNGTFEDGARMESLDVRFAKRYLDAYKAHQSGMPITRSWKMAFDATASDQLSVLQHLLLGINAHINLDLGIAAAETNPGSSIWALERDFASINAIIAELTDKVQDQLSTICPPLGFMDKILETADEGIADFSVNIARRSAWQAATALAFLKGSPRDIFIEGIDEGVSLFAQRIQQPKGWVLRSALRVIHKAETGTVRGKIDAIWRP